MQSLPIIDVQATASRIDQLRIEKGLSVKQLQDIFGFSSPQAIYNWIWGQSLPSVDSLVILATIFEVSIEEILVIK